MSKSEFLKQLKKELHSLKKEERRKNITFYEEYLSDLMETGLTETEAVQKLGLPKEIAKTILKESSPEVFSHHNYVGIGMALGSVFLSVLSLICFLRPYLNLRQPIASVSIIGGADGPTSIFLAGKISSFGWLYGITACFVLLTIFYFWHHSKQNPKSN